MNKSYFFVTNEGIICLFSLKKIKTWREIKRFYFKCVVFSKLVPNKKIKICLANFLVTA